MALRIHDLDARLSELDRLLQGTGADVAALPRWRLDLASLRFHLSSPAHDHPILLAVLGGTGTGKSTLVNRLLDANVSATPLLEASIRTTAASAPPPGSSNAPGASIEPTTHRLPPSTTIAPPPTSHVGIASTGISA